MTIRQALAGLFQLFAVVLFFGSAIFLMLLPFTPALRFLIAERLLESPHCFFIGGLILFGVAFLMTVSFLGIGRGRFLLLRMGGRFSTAIDTKILKIMIDSSLRKKFPLAIALYRLEVIRGKTLELGFHLPPMDMQKRKTLLLAIEKHLQKLLIERLGYHDLFIVQASIGSENPS